MVCQASKQWIVLGVEGDIHLAPFELFHSISNGKWKK